VFGKAEAPSVPESLAGRRHSAAGSRSCVIRRRYSVRSSERCLSESKSTLTKLRAAIAST
jgi:hypothetical protein